MYDDFINQRVILDTDTRMTFVGDLQRADELGLTLQNVVIYDAGDARVPLERWLIECVEFDSDPARREMLVCRERLVALTRLDDIVVPGKEIAGSAPSPRP